MVASLSCRSGDTSKPSRIKSCGDSLRSTPQCHAFTAQILLDALLVTVAITEIDIKKSFLGRGSLVSSMADDGSA